MANSKMFPFLRPFFFRLILNRLFIPLMGLGVIVIAGVGYLEVQNLKVQQYQIVQSIAQIVDHHLNQGGRILNAIALVGETSGTENLSVFMKSTLESYGYFETLYCLDKDNKIKLLVPSDPRYSGLDISNLLDFQNIGEKKNIIISRPFISLRTGDPTVYLIRPLSSGGCVIGELNLGLFQQEITKISSVSSKDFVFIMDQSGTLLAHPFIHLVKQQINMSNLEIFHRSLSGEAHAFYLYNETSVFGSATRIERTGWLIVDQVPVSVFFSSYVWVFGMISLSLLIIWLTLMWNFNKQLKQYVIAPLEQLSLKTNALTIGDFSQVTSLSSIPHAFAELNKLGADFQFMSNSLQVRETALEKANVMLEEEIMELNRTKAKLIDAKKEADNANIAKNNFISNVSHELRTPIAVILSIIQLFEMNIENNVPINQQKVNNHINSLKQNCYRLLRLVNNIIDVTKIDAGFTNLNLKNLNIVYLIEEITRSVMEYSKGKELRVIFDTDEEEIIIAIDPDKIERIMLNLLSNAIKFTQKNGEIYVNIYNTKTKVVISVEDTGIGIPEEKKELIFERFQQIDNTLTRVNEGSGIGLSLVKAFIELHGGSIIVSSELGKGSKFTIELPLKVLDNEQLNNNLNETNNSNHFVDMLNIEFSDIYF